MGHDTAAKVDQEVDRPRAEDLDQGVAPDLVADRPRVTTTQ